MGSENDRTRQGVWKETERCLDVPNQGMKPAKRHKLPEKSLMWADELKRQYTCTLKPSKCSNTDIPKWKTTNLEWNAEVTMCNQGSSGELPKSVPPQQRTLSKKKFFSDVNIENIFVNSDYFKLKSGNTASVSFCSGENGENRWTVDAKNVGQGQRKRATPLTNDKVNKELLAVVNEENGKNKKNNVKKCEASIQGEKGQTIKENLDAVVQEIKALNRHFAVVRTGLKTIEKLIRLQKQTSGKTKHGRKEEIEKSECEDVSAILDKFSDVEKASQEIRDFIDNNRTLLTETEELPPTPDLDKIINNLQRLSETAYQPKIIQTSKGAKFEVPRELPISFYANGMLLRNNEFRKYTDIRAGLFLRDIEDGFFPIEIWPEFPFGVPFQVTDKRHESFNEGNADLFLKFPGDGRRLGSNFDGKRSLMVYLEPTKQDRSTLDATTTTDMDKKKSSTFSSQEHCKNLIRRKQTSNYRYLSEEKRLPERDEDAVAKLSVKVRLGVGDQGMLHLNVLANQKMSHFQDVLFRKLCERYHDEYVRNIGAGYENNFNEIVPDFEMHVYGHRPFRLSESLALYPLECGIVDNCVINITEI